MSELNDQQIKERCAAAGIRWIEPDGEPDGFPGSFDMVTLAEMRALLAAHGVALPSTGPYCAKLAGPCPDGCPTVQLTGCGGGTAGDCWRVKQPLITGDRQ